MDGCGAPERKFQEAEAAASPALVIGEGAVVSGYASRFGKLDQGGDIVLPGAYAVSLAALLAGGRKVRMLWQHDPAQPIGVWDEVAEDAVGLRVKGRILTEVARGREAAALLAAGAMDGLSIGYRTVRATRDAAGVRHLAEVELWEVSLVTFPMQVQARVSGKAEGDAGWHAVAALFEAARQGLAGR